MTSAKLNCQHDYVTLRVTFEDRTTLNFTHSRSGWKLSGSYAKKEIFNFLVKWCEMQKGRTVGEFMEELRGVAERSLTCPAFMASIPHPGRSLTEMVS